MRIGRFIGCGLTCLALLVSLDSATAAPPDWGKVPAKEIPLFYPGPSGLEWVMNPAEHSGARKLIEHKMSCFDCHESDADQIGKDITAGKTVGKKRLILDAGIPKGRVGTFPLRIQAAHDDTRIYLRFEWESPPEDEAKHFDAANEVKLTLLFDAQRVEGADLNGCWASCHMDLRSMPDAPKGAGRHPKSRRLGWNDGVTKYLAESRTALATERTPRGGWNKLRPDAQIAQALKDGKFLDLMQYRSGQEPRAVDGYVLESRHMKGGKSLLKATGERQGRKWSVTFERLLAGAGVGDHTLVPGRPFNFGVAIHENHGAARHHYVSLGYTLGLDDAAAFVNVARSTEAMPAVQARSEAAPAMH